MKRLKLIPILGLKTDVPADDGTLLKFVSDNVALSHDTGGLNVDYRRQPGACSKSYGYSAWSNSAVGSPASCQGLYELYDDTNRNQLLWENGNVFYYDGSKDPVQINPKTLDYDNQSGSFSIGDTITGGTSSATADIAKVDDNGATGTLYLENISGTFQNDEQLDAGGGNTADADGTVTTQTFVTGQYLISMCRYGDHVVFEDYGISGVTGGPYKWKDGDDACTPVITKDGVTEYKFRYVVEWQRRIIGACSNYSFIEIRYTDDLPTLTSASGIDFPDANQLYKPTTDYITGVSKMGRNALYLYGSKSISRIEYTGNVTIPFVIIGIIDDQGCQCHHSIVNVDGSNFFFNDSYGFVRYNGGTSLRSGDSISRDIDDQIQTIDPDYYDTIVGTSLPLQREICWAVPISGATSPNRLMYFNLDDGSWRFENFAARYVDAWTRASGEYQKPVFGNTDGHVYQITGDTLPSTSELDGYRIEPILDFGAPFDIKILHEIWFEVVAGGSYSLDVYYRAGDTTKEVLAASWTSLGSLSLNNPAEPRIVCNASGAGIIGRKIQIKWGTNLDSEYFSVNGIHFLYDYESRF